MKTKRKGSRCLAWIIVMTMVCSSLVPSNVAYATDADDTQSQQVTQNNPNSSDADAAGDETKEEVKKDETKTEEPKTEEPKTEEEDTTKNNSNSNETQKEDANSGKSQSTGFSLQSDEPSSQEEEKGVVAKIGNVDYTTLEDAVKALQNNDTLVLQADATYDVVIPAKLTVTLDLNGKKLTNATGHTITNNGTLTITGEGTVDNVTHARAALLNNANATVTLDGGTYTRSEEKGTDKETNGGNSYYNILNKGNMTINEGVTVSQSGKYSSMICNLGTAADNEADLTINNGTFEGGLNTVKNDDWGKLIVENGTFKNTTQAAIMNWHKATIKNGTFTSDGPALLNGVYVDKSGVKKGEGKLTITGGTFTSGADQTADIQIPESSDKGSSGTIQISGGTFSEDVDFGYIVKGYDTELKDDGMYHIVAVEKLVKINDGRKFHTLADAVDAAAEGDTITVLRDGKSAGTKVTDGKNITIDLAGHTLLIANKTVGSTGTETNGFQLLKGTTVTIKDGTIKPISNKLAILVQNYCDLTLEDVTLDASEASNCQYLLSNNFGNTTIKGNTNMYAYKGERAFDLWFGLSSSYYDGVSVTFANDFTGTVQGAIEYGASENGATAVPNWKDKTKLTINGTGTFNTTFEPTINGALTKANIQIAGGTFSEDVDFGYIVKGYDTELKDDGMYHIVAVEKLVKINNGAEYHTLAEAVDAATIGDTITVLRDGKSAGTKVKAGKNITIDLAGHTLLIANKTVGSTGTETNGFQLLKESTVTIKNGTIKPISSKLAILVQNYCDLTLEDVTLDASEASNCEYLLSNNFGDTTIKGNTNMYAYEGERAFDLWFGLGKTNTYYDGVSVTFANDFTGTVQGTIEYGASEDGALAVSDWKEKTKLTINGTGTFNTTFEPTINGALTDANIKIAGGTFRENPSEHLADDYAAEETNGVFVVKKDITGIDLSATTATVQVGETYQLHASVLPAGAVNKTFTWSSSNDEFATVDENGLVTAKTKGTATITVTAKDKNNTDVKATCKVIVTSGARLVRIGSRYYDTFEEAVANAADGNTIEIQKDITIEKSIDINKNLTLKAKDGATVSVATDNALQVTEGKTLKVQGITFKATAKDTTLIDTTAGGKITFTNNTVTGDENGSIDTVIKGVQPDSVIEDNIMDHAAIMVTLADASNSAGTIQICRNTLKNAATAVDISELSVEDLQKLTFTIAGNTFDNVIGVLNISDTQNTVIDGYTLSLDENHANGKACTVTEGIDTEQLTTTPAWIVLTPYYNGNGQLVQDVTGITLNTTAMTVTEGDSALLIPTLAPVADAYTSEIKWTSSDENIATVSNGLVKAVKAGNVTITATAGNKLEDCAISVTSKASAEEATQTVVKPSLEGEEGEKTIKQEDIVTAIEQAAEKEKVSVVVPEGVKEAPIIQESVLEKAKENNSALVIDTPAIENQSLRAIFSFDKIENAEIPVNTAIQEKPSGKTFPELEGDANTTILSLGHEGAFPGEAKITVKLEEGSPLAEELTAYMYYLNNEGELELTGNQELPIVDKQVSFTLAHASDYVLSSQPMKADAANDSVYNLITAIGNVVYTADSKAKIDAARKAFTTLSSQYSGAISSSINETIINEAEKTYQDLEKGVTELQSKVGPLMSAGGILTYKEQKRVAALMSEYNKLTEEQKAAFDNSTEGTKLVELNEANKATEDANAKSQAGRVTKEVDKIPSTITYSAASKSAIDRARNLYNSVIAETPAAKALLTDEINIINQKNSQYLAAKRTAYSQARMTLSSTRYTYNGKAMTPGVNGLSAFVRNVDYTVAYRNNVKTGTATVTVTSRGDCAGIGAKTATFIITPAKASVSKVKGSKKAFKVTVKSQKSAGVSGYQISYSTKKTKSFKSVKTSSTSKTIKKLKRRKTYYVKVRSYKVINGTTYYGSYSSVKKVKTK